MPAPEGNQYALGNKGGAPPRFETAEALLQKVEEYFEWCKGELNTDPEKAMAYKRNPEPLTVTGLALFLGFESRQSLYDYEKNDVFSYIIKHARLKVENAYEINLQTSRNPAGSIFALKNMGWADRSEVKHEGLPDPTISVKIERPKGDDE